MCVCVYERGIGGYEYERHVWVHVCVCMCGYVCRVKELKTTPLSYGGGRGTQLTNLEELSFLFVLAFPKAAENKNQDCN